MPSGRWVGSTRAARLPADWPQRRAQAMTDHDGVCHLCGQPGADRVDHIQAGDDHSPSNLAPVHDAVPPHCHRFKSAREGVAARTYAPRRRPTEPHPGVIA